MLVERAIHHAVLQIDDFSLSQTTVLLLRLPRRYLDYSYFFGGSKVPAALEIESGRVSIESKWSCRARAGKVAPLDASAGQGMLVLNDLAGVVCLLVGLERLHAALLLLAFVQPQHLTRVLSSLSFSDRIGLLLGLGDSC